jgi:hypothetical protein
MKVSAIMRRWIGTGSDRVVWRREKRVCVGAWLRHTTAGWAQVVAWDGECYTLCYLDGQEVQLWSRVLWGRNWSI